jgi:hypothetical protein
MFLFLVQSIYIMGLLYSDWCTIYNDWSAIYNDWCAIYNRPIAFWYALVFRGIFIPIIFLMSRSPSPDPDPEPFALEADAPWVHGQRRHQSTRWGVVYNLNTDRAARQAAWNALCERDIVKGFVYQLEQGRYGGNLHIQGYIQFTRNVRFSFLRSALPGCHLFRCNGSHDDNVRYCTKDDTRVEGPFASDESFCRSRYTDRLLLPFFADHFYCHAFVFDPFLPHPPVIVGVGAATCRYLAPFFSLVGHSPHFSLWHDRDCSRVVYSYLE